MSETPTPDGLLRAERRVAGCSARGRRGRARPVAGRSAGSDRAGRFPVHQGRRPGWSPLRIVVRYTKDDDLAGHRSGSSVISELVEEHVEVLVAGTTGVTFFIGRVSGTFEGQPMTVRLRYTRTWVHDIEVGWRIVAAHIAVLAPEA